MIIRSKVDLFIIILALLALLMVGAFSVANAQDVDVRQSNDQNLQTTGDVRTGGGTSVALFNALGDVDIGQCRFSTQWGTPLFSKQRIVLDETCVGFQFLKLGQYAVAAMHFCNEKDTLVEYASEIDCEVAHTFKPDEPDNPPPNLIGLYDQAAQFNEHYELAQQQEQEIEYLQQEQASLVGRLDELTALIEQAPAPVQQQAPQYTDEQVNAVWAALNGSEEEDDE